MCAVLFDGPVLEQALPEAGSLMALGVEEINLFEKVHQIIRASPGKAEGLIEKFRQILKEEKKEELICNQCPGGVRALHKRGVGLRRKLAKKKKASKEKKNKKILKIKKTKQNIKVKQGKRQRKNYLENSCTELWSDLINAGLGIATTLRKQVMDIDLVIKK